MVASVSLPEANLVPLHAPLAVQLEATGVVDQVSTGVRLPVAEVWFAVKLMVPALCACAHEASTSRGRARKAIVSLCIFQPIASDAEAGMLPAKAPVLGRAGHAETSMSKTAAAQDCRQTKNRGRTAAFRTRGVVTGQGDPGSQAQTLPALVRIFLCAEEFSCTHHGSALLAGGDEW